MIEKPTVLILGAGASAPYHFPLGSELVDKALELTNYHDDRVQLIAEAAAVEPAVVVEFAEALRLSASSSIDAFIEGRLDDYIDVGKAVIAALLIPYEVESTLFQKRDGAWYPELLSRMGGTAAQFQQNNLAILTFNYDRSLEHFLITAACNRFNVGRPQAIQLLQGYRIEHLHGQLGGIDGIDLRAIRPYEPTVTVATIKDAMSGISIIHEDRLKKERPFQHASELIRDADDVMFLGFGFHPTNLFRLGFDARKGKSAMRGTCRGLQQAEVQRITNFMKRTAPAATLRLAPQSNEDVLMFLRRHWDTPLVAREE